MATHGKNGKVYVDGFDLTEFIKSVSLDSTKESPDTTTFSANSKAYIAGLFDSTATVDGVADNDPDGLDAMLEEIDALETIPYSYYPFGDTAETRGYGVGMERTAHAKSQSVTEEVNFTLGLQGKVKRDYIASITPLVELGAESTAYIDMGADTTDGGVVYVHITGIDAQCTVTIQESTDGLGAGLDTVTSIVDVSTTGGYRIEVAGAIARYIRVTVAGLTGTDKVTLQAGIKFN